jgi:hypothetical protein
MLFIIRSISCSLEVLEASAFHLFQNGNRPGVTKFFTAPGRGQAANKAVDLECEGELGVYEVGVRGATHG